jgi:D-glycero-D-manno-heptose 1,7-bisphosphate phosphatase
MGTKPIFIDRDGVLNVDVSPYISSLEQLQLFPWTIDALTKLHESGFEIYIISNQQGVALGITTPDALDQITEEIQDAVRVRGFEIRKFYHCTALDSANHPWRKPLPGMILAARDEFDLNLEGSFFIGDKWSDIECGAVAGCRPLLVLTGVTAPGSWEAWKHKPEKVFANLGEAVDWIVENDAVHSN